jgi:hypothetical protein
MIASPDPYGSIFSRKLPGAVISARQKDAARHSWGTFFALQ